MWINATNSGPCQPLCSEATPQGRKKTTLNQTLLNGNNICMVGYPFLKMHTVDDPTLW